MDCQTVCGSLQRRVQMVYDLTEIDNGADVFQQGDIDSIGDRFAPAQAKRFPGVDA